MASINAPRIRVITRKGQITIPIELRKELDLHVGDRVELVREGDGIIVRRVRNFGERTAGIFAKYRLDTLLTLEETIKAERECFEQALVEDAERLDFE